MIKKIHEKQPAIGGTRELRDGLEYEWNERRRIEDEYSDITRECRLCLLNKFMHKSELGTV